jgi:hypothetical protein
MSRQAFVHPPYLSIYVVLIVVFQEATAATVEVPTTVSSGAMPASEEEDVPGDGNKVVQWKQVASFRLTWFNETTLVCFAATCS